MVRFEAVSVRYRRDSREATSPDVLRNVSFNISTDSFQWIMGPAGTGKTTILRLINMTLRPTKGQVVVFGVSTESVRGSALSLLRKQMGIILQESRLLPHLSVFDNIALPLRLRGRSEGQIRAEVIEMLRWMGLISKLVSLPRELSKSERQRVLIARAVISRPRLLLADEPTTHLDEYQAERIIHLLHELHRLGSTVIIASHNEALAERYPGPMIFLPRNALINAG